MPPVCWRARGRCAPLRRKAANNRGAAGAIHGNPTRATSKGTKRLPRSQADASSSAPNFGAVTKKIAVHHCVVRDRINEPSRLRLLFCAQGRITFSVIDMRTYVIIRLRFRLRARTPWHRCAALIGPRRPPAPRNCATRRRRSPRSPPHHQASARAAVCDRRRRRPWCP